jgi:hypothetical protein
VIAGLLVFGAFMALMLYIAFVFTVGSKLQDWAYSNGYPDFAIPWLCMMGMLFGLPIAIAVGVSS